MCPEMSAPPIPEIAMVLWMHDPILWFLLGMEVVGGPVTAYKLRRYGKAQVGIWALSWGLVMLGTMLGPFIYEAWYAAVQQWYSIQTAKLAGKTCTATSLHDAFVRALANGRALNDVANLIFVCGATLLFASIASMILREVRPLVRSRGLRIRVRGSRT